jgi:hypothetical protein
MRGRETYNFVEVFRKIVVQDLARGSLLDIAPMVCNEIVKQLVQERKARNPTAAGMSAKARGKQPARDTEPEAAVVEPDCGKALQDEGNLVTNFYTKARIMMTEGRYNLHYVLVNAGSVVNLAPLPIFQRIGSKLEKTDDLVIRTANATLVKINWYSDLEVKVASVAAQIRVYAIPTTPGMQSTYSLLLSRRWLKQCQVLGDYAKGTYIVHDRLGRHFQVVAEREEYHPRVILRIATNPQSTQVNLVDEVVAELGSESRSRKTLAMQIVSSLVMVMLIGFRPSYLFIKLL